MQPSSLIFVLVVAIWAAYLLQYWIKRRDHLSTIRSVDRFSAAMRVLDDHRRSRDAAEPTPRSYAVAPTRAARPEVTVKHAGADRVVPQRGRAVEPIVGAPRKVRGLTLVAMLALLPVIVLGTAMGPLPWWVAVVWTVGTFGAFGWLRQGVMAERQARAHARAAQRRAEPAPMARQAEARLAETRQAAPRSAVAPREAVPRRAEAPFDVAEGEAPVEPVAAPAPVAAQAAVPEPGTWAPTPVPRPMYTMKAKAERPQPTPAAKGEATPPAAGPEIPQVIDVEDEELPAIAGWG